MVSGWLGVRMVERYLPLNMREMGDSTVPAYSRPCIRQHRRAQCSERMTRPYRVVPDSHLGLCLALG